MRDIAEPGATPLWNPNAAAAWSLFFGPAFGAFLHMKNWQALGDAENAAVSRRWVIGVLLLLFGTGAAGVLWPPLAGYSSASTVLGLALLLTWYVSSARRQIRYVGERFGTSYARRGWSRPLALGFLVFVGFIVFVTALAIAVSFVHVA